MTFTPEKDLANHIRFIAEYEDGSNDVFAVPECTLRQGPSAVGIARTRCGRMAARWVFEGRSDCWCALAAASGVYAELATLGAAHHCALRDRRLICSGRWEFVGGCFDRPLILSSRLWEQILDLAINELGLRSVFHRELSVVIEDQPGLMTETF